MASKLIRELALNFMQRMKEAKLHERRDSSPIYSREINTRMIEFFTGAYVALRTFDRTDDAREVGVFTATTLAPLGYRALLRTLDGEDPLPPANVLLDIRRPN